MADHVSSLIYVGDPMCSWCWGFAPEIETLAAELPTEVVVGGLRPGPMAQPIDDRMAGTLEHHWDEIAERTGQPFDTTFLDRRDGWVYDTEPAAIAVTHSERPALPRNANETCLWNCEREVRRPTIAHVPEEATITLQTGPREACGVIAAYSTTQRVSHLLYFGLFALQHRGQESAGIATSDGETVTVFKDLGLVNQVFDESTLAGLDGHLGIGHTRYSTTGSNNWANAQPTHRQVGNTSVALGHNGNLTNTEELARSLGIRGATTDSDLMAESLARAINDNRSDGRGLELALMEVAPTWEGAFSLVIMDQGRVVGMRDPHGFRPLCLGSIDEGGWVIASESSALDLVGATFVREVAPGEMIVVDAGGPKSYYPFEETGPRLCVFEFVYFARPDTHMYGRSVQGARYEMGRILSGEHPADGDVVIPVPESGIPAAQGFAANSGIPYSDGLVKNRYVGRTFIEPTQLLRDQGIRLKLNPIPESLDGRRVILVDDSIVRGSTTRQLVAMVREAGASEVHLRVSSPPYRWPCYYGMDTSDRSTLIAARMEVDEIRQHLGADSLGYLSIEGLLEATGVADAGFCTACLSGDYPTPVPITSDKYQLERS